MTSSDTAADQIQIDHYGAITICHQMLNEEPHNTQYLGCLSWLSKAIIFQ